MNYKGFCLKAQSLSKIGSCYFFNNFYIIHSELITTIISPSSQVKLFGDGVDFNYPLGVDSISMKNIFTDYAFDSKDRKKEFTLHPFQLRSEKQNTHFNKLELHRHK